MKKFIAGFLTALMLSMATTVIAATYTAQTAAFPIFINGKKWETTKPILAIDGSTYLPLKAVGEALGVNVEWNSVENRVDIGDTSVVGQGYSRSNPAPIGTIQTVNVNNWLEKYTCDIKVESVLRGSKAWSKIKEANMFNEQAPDGQEYILAKVVVSCSYVENDASLDVSDYDFKAFSGNNSSYDKPYIVTPKPNLQTIYAGSNTSGYVAFLVNKDDANPKMVYGQDYNGTGGIWFNLYETK